MPARCLIVRNEDAPITREVTSRAFSRVEGYGVESGQWRAERIEETPEGTRFHVRLDGDPYLVTCIALGGAHNVRNALAVIAAAREQGLEPHEIAAGLAAFEGVARRLELRGEIGGVAVLDDFAHHPTAIVETLRAVRRRYPGRRVRAVLEPRSWSLRRNVFQQRLAECFDDADEVIVAGVFRAADVPEAERLDLDRLVRDVTTRGPVARHLTDVDDIVRTLTESSRSGDVVVVMSNGGFGGLHARLLEALEARRESA